MRYVAMLALALLALAACGGDETAGSGDTGFLPGVSGTEGMPEVVELTDEMMGEYVELAKELHSMGQSGNPAAAWLKARGWDWKKWSAVASQVHMAMAAGAMQGLSDALGSLDDQIAKLEARHEATSGQERDMLETQLETLKEQRDSVAGQADTPWAKDPQLKKNYEVLKRWLPKLQAIGD